MSLFACLHFGMIISRCLLGGKMFLLSHSECSMVLGKVAYYHRTYFAFHIRNLIDRITKLNIGCYYSSCIINLLA